MGAPPAKGRAVPPLHSWVAFSLVALAMVLTPGPNMIYLISRSVSQGARAGLVSLAGIGCAFLVFISFAAFGLTALLFAIPFAYDVLRIAGAIYILYLAWQAVRPGGSSPFHVTPLAPDGPRRLFVMGFLTNILNPKAALMYLSLLPQFIDPARGRMLTQLLVLGATQITISMVMNGLITLGAGRISHFLRTRPRWMLAQRWVMGGALASIAVKMVR
jgi:threonine/homoserine/homoserine lactone efflux protein